MNRFFVPQLALCVAIGLFYASPLCAQDKSFHRMEIVNGSVRTVHYFLDRATPAEAADLIRLEQAENEMLLARDLTALRRQYVSDEQLLEARRANVQRLLYGYSTEYSTELYSRWRYDNYAYGLYPYGNYGFGNYQYGNWGGGGYPCSYYGGVLSGRSAQSLAVGVGDEGRIKTEMARTLANQATSAHTAEAYENLRKPLASPRLSAIFGAAGDADKKAP
jgi:hypothetical protein